MNQSSIPLKTVHISGRIPLQILDDQTIYYLGQLNKPTSGLRISYVHDDPRQIPKSDSCKFFIDGVQNVPHEFISDLLQVLVNAGATDFFVDISITLEEKQLIYTIPDPQKGKICARY